MGFNKIIIWSWANWSHRIMVVYIICVLHTNEPPILHIVDFISFATNIATLFKWLNRYRIDHKRKWTQNVHTICFRSEILCLNELQNQSLNSSVIQIGHRGNVCYVNFYCFCLLPPLQSYYHKSHTQSYYIYIYMTI